MTTETVIDAARERMRSNPHISDEIMFSPDITSIAPISKTLVEVTGVESSWISWNALGSHLQSVLSEEASRSTSCAVHTVHPSNIMALSVSENETARIAIRRLLTAGAWTSVLITARKGSTVMIDAHSPYISDTAYGSTMVLVDIQPNASVMWNGRILGNKTFHAIEYITHVADGGNFQHTECITGCASVRSRVSAHLAGSGSRIVARRGCVGNRNERYDVGMRAIHTAPDTVSDLLSKAVLGGASQSYCSGMLRMNKDAPGAIGAQRMETLLLSSDAEALAVPGMEVDVDNVQCTHGAAVSHIRDDDLFYLRSRGISRKDAISLIAAGFIQDMFCTDISKTVSDAVEEEL